MSYFKYLGRENCRSIQADAWLYGTKTTKDFTASREPKLDETFLSVPNGDFVAQTDASLYYVSIDTLGEIGWESGTFCKPGRPDAHVIEVLTEKTPLAYRSYLRQKGVSYILAGKDTLDCRIAAEKLYDLFGIETMLICGGGTVNWTFLQQGVLDELSLLLAPVADGSPDTYYFMWMDVGRTYFEPLLDYNTYADIKDYTKDVLILHGDADSIVPLSYSKKAVDVYSSAQLEVLPGAGHDFYGDDAEQAIGYITEYLNAHID